MNSNRKDILALEYLVFGNYVISLAAVALSYHTYLIFKMQPDLKLLGALFFSTLSVYSLHSYFRNTGDINSRRIYWIQQNKKFLLVQAILSGVTTSVLIVMQSALLPVMAVLAVLSLVYSLPRIIGNSNLFLTWITYYKTFYLAITWTLVTFILPFYYSTLNWSPDVIINLLARFLILLQLCLLFERKDRTESLKTGLDVMVNKLSDKGFLILLYTNFLLLAFLITSNAFKESDISNTLPVFFTAIYLLMMVKMRRKERSDLWYYIFWDGSLFLPALIYQCTRLFQ